MTGQIAPVEAAEITAAVAVAEVVDVGRSGSASLRKAASSVPMVSRHRCVILSQARPYLW